MKLDSKLPKGPLENKWDKHKATLNLVNPSNRHKHTVLIVGTGLAGASAGASLAELGYNVKCFCIQDSPRRAHSIAAQGGINAARANQIDGDSVWRLFYDTIKGGDYRSREDNVYRLAEISTRIIDQCVAQGVPFAREYGGVLAKRSFGGTQVSRTFYSRGQTGQQLLLGAYGSLMRQVDAGQAEIFPRREMLELIDIDGHARGIVVRNLVNGEIEHYTGDAVILATGGYGNVFYLSTNAKNSNATAAWRCYKKGAYFANPCYTQIHPTCIPVSGHYQSKLTLMSESLRNDGRVWVPKNKDDKRPPQDIPETDRDYYLERKYPSFGNLVPRDVASRNAKVVCDEGKGVGESGLSVYLDFAETLEKYGRDVIEEKYGNLFEMYERITNENPYKTPMRIFPAVHYTMGGLWVDYNLMSTMPGLFVLGEANFSDHGSNRLGASALMQGLADGYFVIPFTIGNYISSNNIPPVDDNSSKITDIKEDARQKIDKLFSIKGSKSPTYFHQKLGHIMWDDVGMSRNENGLKNALEEIPKLREEFWNDLKISGEDNYMNKNLEFAGRLADFLELGELMALDALTRAESCGCHFRDEYQTPDHEALRDDENYKFVSAWEYKGENKKPELHKEDLEFNAVELTQRSYK